MKICGIIAEYNPLHNGHVYQIGKARELTGCDYVVVCMSGDFVQRGLPAICDKYSRARMALLAGADAVFELPCAYSTGSSKYFANAAVYMLGSLGCDYICFGSETGDIDKLKTRAFDYKEFEENNKDEIAAALRKGKSYAKALNEDIGSNDRLAVLYINAINEYGFDMEPVCVKREGAYLDHDIKSGSATAIRDVISRKEYDCLNDYMPDFSRDILFDENHVHRTAFACDMSADKAHVVLPDDFSDLLYGKLLVLKQKGGNEAYMEYQDVSGNIAGHIIKELNSFKNLSGFAQSIHSAEYTRGRIDRALIHILLDLKKEVYAEEYIRSIYARLLGFRISSSMALNELKARSRIPTVSKCADASKVLTGRSAELFERDIAAANMYDYILSKQSGRACIDENTKEIVIVK